jgi:hypothetical protein
MDANPLTALVLVLEAAKARLLTLIEEREARHQDALAALECATSARAYGRLLDADLGHALVHLHVARDFAAEARARCTPTHGPAEVEDSLMRARENARRAVAHLRLFTEEHAEETAAVWRHRDGAAWDAAVFRHAWAVRACTRCGVRVPDDRPSYVHARTGAETHYCSDRCDSSAPATGACALCRGPVYDDRFARTLPSGLPVRYCSTACGAEAAQAEIDERQELEAAELALMEDAARDYDAALDLDDVPF